MATMDAAVTGAALKNRLAESALKIALGYADAGMHAEAGHDRGAQVDKFLAAVGMPPGQPWCAAGVSYCWLKALAMLTGGDITPTSLAALKKPLSGLVFSPSASCAAIMRDAQVRGSWIGNAASDALDVEPAWLVTFRWDGEACEPGALPQHIGIVAAAEDVLHTVEFNTGNPAVNQSDGGWVMRKTRRWDEVVGLVRTW